MLEIKGSDGKLWYKARRRPDRGATMPDNVDWGLVVSVLTLILSVLVYRQANKKAEDTKNASRLGLRLQAINHIRNALWDTEIDGNITTRTTDSIRDALQLSALVFDDEITQTLKAAHEISFRLQNTSSDERNDALEQIRAAAANSSRTPPSRPRASQCLALNRFDVMHTAAIPMGAEPAATRCGEMVE
jgi:hypothetical protein